MTRLIMILIAIALAMFTTLFYRAVNHGLSSSSKHQMITRLTIASLIAMAPMTIAGTMPDWRALTVAAVASLSWIVCYPLLYHLTNRRVSSDYDNQIDIAFGLYAFGALTALSLIAGAWKIATLGVVVGLAEFAMLLLTLSQTVYYLMYQSVVDFNGMQLIQATDVNEVFEFAKLYSRWKVALVALGVAAILAACVWLNITPGTYSPVDQWVPWVEIAASLAILWIIFVGRKAPWKRTGIVEIYLTVLDYRRRNSHYAERAKERLEQLEVKQCGTPSAAPSTVIMVIGESANRDYMSAFTPLDRETTPWLSEMSDDKRFTLFPNAYSCAMQTVNSLERALTERNLYNDKPFDESVSIIDVAHKLGYTVHWYSNQGHLGAFDTQITLVADTADVAKWTNQQFNKLRYDESLLDFLDEVDPTKNNLVVIHLQGSHFNFENRYPREAEQWEPDGKDDNVVCYMNSIHYTDSILRRIFDYGTSKLNLQAMVYFSDHATIPDRTRTPGFLGFGMTRIPLFVYLSDEYRANHAERATALNANREKYFTNDLAYELMCGILDADCAEFERANSLASESYRFTRDMLLTYDGKVKISDDDTKPHKFQRHEA